MLVLDFSGGGVHIYSYQSGFVYLTETLSTLCYLQKKPKFMGKEHPVAEGSKFGIGTESLFFEKVSLCKIGIFLGVDKSLASPQGKWKLRCVAQKTD